MELPESFKRTVIGTYPGGEAWLERLPALIEECAAQWSLTVSPALAKLSYNYVAPAVCSDGTEAVLKLGPPNPDLSAEMAALQFYNGEGAARLLECDPDIGALLEERIRPGVMLSTLEDDSEATLLAAEVMRKLWRPLPPDHPFPTLARWFRSLTGLRERFDGGTGPLPVRLFEEAASLFADLNSSQHDPVLLHGDLHHYNVLTAERAPWLAIDPKGIYGDRAFDTAQYLLNPWPDLLERPDAGRLLARRIDQLSEALSLERVRIRGWGIANAVLSACWGVEDGEETGRRYDLACAELLSGIKV